MIARNSSFRKLDETEKFTVGHVYECAYLIRKGNKHEIDMGDFYGDPKCGLIDSNNRWCLVGGDTLSVWTEDTGLIRMEDEELAWVCKVRQKSEHEAELLIDPWSDKGAIWILNVNTLERYKVKDHKQNGEYTDQIEW